MSTQPEISDRERILTRVFLTATAANCIFQIVWFWRFDGENITMDTVNSRALARHLVDRNWIASTHGYWSPSFPWLIAAAAATTANWTLLGRILTIGTFLLCLPLLYVLNFRLWRSHVAAPFAVLWFSLAHGLIVLAVGSILASFLPTACAVGCLIVLLAFVVWGSPRDPACDQILEKLRHATGAVLSNPVTDPDKGEVGTWLFLQPRAC